MTSKAFLVLGVLLAVILVISTEVAAREPFEYSNAEETSEFVHGVFAFYLYLGCLGYG